MIRRFHIALVFLFAVTSINAQTIGEQHNLQFKTDSKTMDGWVFGPKWDKTPKVMIDSSDSRHPLVLQQRVFFNTVRNDLKFSLLTNGPIFIPELEESSLKVFVTYGMNAMQGGTLIVSSMDAALNLIRTDSLTLNANDGHWRDSIEVCSSETKAVRLEIDAVGKHEEEALASISLFGIDIFSGTTNVNSLPAYDIPVPVVNSRKCIPLHDEINDSSKGIKNVSGRITALGESVHGSSEITSASIEFVKSGIINNEVALVILEAPMLNVMFLDRFVQGNDDFSSEELKEIYEHLSMADFGTYNTFLPDHVLALADWLRDYNLNHSRKVHVAGNDLEYFFGINDLYSYLKRLLERKMEQKSGPLLNRMYDVFKKHYPDQKKVSMLLEMINDSRKEYEMEFPCEYAMLEFFLSYLKDSPLADEQGGFFVSGEYGRERVMFDFAKYSLDRYCGEDGRAIIMCHEGHACYNMMAPSNERTFGSFMKEQYGDDYHVLVETISAGKVKYKYSSDDDIYMDLLEPSNNCIEKSLPKDSGCLFIDSKDLPELIKIRIKGGGMTQKEVYVCPRSQFDGIVHVQ